jgi:hypothetical protein
MYRLETMGLLPTGMFLAPIYGQEDETVMVWEKSRETSSVPVITIGFSERARRFFFGTLSARCVRLDWRKQKDEEFLGYESSWPDSYKKLH